MLVFVSYSHKNRDFASDLVRRLTQWGYETWIDFKDIAKGDYWPDAIDRGLAAADVVVGLMTESAMELANVKNEWDWAISNDKPLLLLRREECTISLGCSKKSVHSGLKVSLTKFWWKCSTDHLRHKSPSAAQ